MDRKKVAIGVLAALAVLLGGLVAGGIRDGQALAKGSVYDTYLAVSAEVAENFVNFVILDTGSRRAVFYNMSPPNYQMQPSTGVMLERDFQRQSSAR